MGLRKAFIGKFALLIMSLATGVAFAVPPEGALPPLPMFQQLELSGICADQQYLYVMAGGKIMQYGLTDLRLVRSVDLPALVPPSVAPASETELSNVPPPPPIAGPHGLWVNESYLYVLAGPVVYQYLTPDLTLQNTVELPKPESPQDGN